MIDEQIKLPVSEEVEEALLAKRYSVVVNLGDNCFHRTGLSFAPFVGLEIDTGGRKVKLSRVFWSGHQFECEIA